MVKTDVDNNNTYHGNNWAFQIKLILSEIGLNNLWCNQNNLTNRLLQERAHCVQPVSLQPSCTVW